MLFPKCDRPSLTPKQNDTQCYNFAYCSLVFLDNKPEAKGFLNDGSYSLKHESELLNVLYHLQKPQYRRTANLISYKQK